MKIQGSFCLKFVIRYLIVLSGLIFFGSLKADQINSIELARDSQITVNMLNDQRLNIKIASNPSTGFRWALKNPKSISCLILKEGSFETTSRAIGAPGFQRWSIRNSCQLEGSHLLRFEYIRPWELNVPASAWAEILVVIKP